LTIWVISSAVTTLTLFCFIFSLISRIVFSMLDFPFTPLFVIELPKKEGDFSIYCIDQTFFDVVCSPHVSRKKMEKKAYLIGLTGTNGAGKGEVAFFFVERGFTYFSLSDVIREELQKNNQKITRNNLIRMGNFMRQQFSPEILARRVAKKIEGNAVIDSIRNPQEVEFFRSQGNFMLLAIDAPPELRFERVKIRGREESASSFQEFLAKEAEEMGTDEISQQLLACMDMADHMIINDGTLEDLRNKLEEFL
jgi:dephospho-CoA kinase